MEDPVEVTRAGPLASVSLNRPEVRNAFNARMIDQLTEVFREIAADAGVRVVLLGGAGAAFSAGADVSWMRASLHLSRAENLADALRMADMFAAVDSLPKPVVARVHGAALGGGMGLLAVSDLVVAAEGTVFGFTEAKLGIIPAVISRFVLPKIGESWARALFTTAERFGTDLARQIGLVHWIAPLDELDTLVEAKVAELLSSGPEAVKAAKMLIAESSRQNHPQLRQRTAERIAELRTGAEGQEGLSAFLEKRKPGWSLER